MFRTLIVVLQSIFLLHLGFVFPSEVHSSSFTVRTPTCGVVVLPQIGLHAHNDIEEVTCSTAQECCAFCASIPNCTAWTLSETVCRAYARKCIVGSSCGVNCSTCTSGFMGPPSIPSLQGFSLTLQVESGWVYINETKQNISVSGTGTLRIDPSKQTVHATSSSGAAGPPQEILLDGSASGTRNFINVLSQSMDPSKATPHNHTYPASEIISDPADQDFCDWINPRPCSWESVEAYWAAFTYVGEIDVRGQPCANFGQVYSYGSGKWAVERAVELAFFRNGSLARLDHTEHRSWGVTHSVDLAVDIVPIAW